MNTKKIKEYLIYEIQLTSAESETMDAMYKKYENEAFRIAKAYADGLTKGMLKALTKIKEEEC